jgi:hypothetical protein
VRYKVPSSDAVALYRRFQFLKLTSVAHTSCISVSAHSITPRRYEFPIVCAQISFCDNVTSVHLGHTSLAEAGLVYIAIRLKLKRKLNSVA